MEGIPSSAGPSQELWFSNPTARWHLCLSVPLLCLVPQDIPVVWRKEAMNGLGTSKSVENLAGNLECPRSHNQQLVRE